MLNECTSPTGSRVGVESKLESFGELIGSSQAMLGIFDLIRKVASNRSNVLITGESGTGKEVVARTLHNTGKRATHPFIPINCTALPAELLESELFGHAKGSFTGAHTAKKGLFAEANRGTLFLDEIGDMPLPLQGKLLRVLQDHEIRPVGSNHSSRIDVRIICATNQALEEGVGKGTFREDLYYRLNVIPINIPPLDERPTDIPPLVAAFLRKHKDEDEPEARGITQEALELLCRSPWAGNARELENVIERALALSDHAILDLEDLEIPRVTDALELPDVLRPAANYELTLREANDRYIESVLERNGGNKSRAAKILGINRRTLYRHRQERVG